MIIMFDALRDLVLFVQFKKRENTHGGVSILVKLQALACNFTKINTPSWVFLTFFKLYKWYQIVQRTTYLDSCHYPGGFSSLIYSMILPV